MLLSVASYVSSSTYSYYPLFTTLEPVEPPLTLALQPGTGGYVGPNGTSAHAYLELTVAPALDLLQNWDFNEGLSYWSYYAEPPLQWEWDGTPPLGASGGAAALGGVFPKGQVEASGYVYQYFSVPYSVSVDVSLRLYVYAHPPGQFGRVDISITLSSGPGQPPLVTCIASVSTRGSWDTPGLSCDPPLPYGLAPGSYVFNASFTVYVKGARSTSVTVYVDYLRLYATLARFEGDFLAIANSDTKPYYARLTLDTSSYLDKLTAYVVIRNSTHSSTPISIQGGTLVEGSTSWVEVPALSSDIYISASFPSTGYSATLNMYLQYCTLPSEGGACVYYPLVVVLQS